MSASGADASGDVDGERILRAHFKRTMAYYQAHRWQDAVDGFDDVLQRLEHVSGDQHDLRLGSMVTRIACLDELRQTDESVRACDAFLSRYQGSGIHDEIGLLADVLTLKSRALRRSGAGDKERDVLQKLISDYADEPLARGQVAAAMYNEAVYLRDADRGDQAVALWDQLWARFADDVPASARFVPIRGQLAKSAYLARTGRLDAALLTCEQMLRECHRRSLPDDEVRRAQRRCVGIAQRNQGITRKLRRLFKPA